MPSAIPHAVRLRIWDLAQQQLPASAIAGALALPTRTIRNLLAAFRAAGQAAPADFSPCGRRQSVAFEALRLEALDLRRQHRGWGARRILAHWHSCGRREGLPDPGTVRRWLRVAGLAPTAAQPPAAPPRPRAVEAHEVWQMDSAEAKALRGGRKVCWLRLVDEASGAALFTRVFDRPRWAAVGAVPTQQALREALARWGRPGGLRVDNGVPWVSPDGGELPSDLQLWLAGLDVALHRNRAGVPQDNPKVERSQRTCAEWAGPADDSAEQLQARADEEDRIQREVYHFDGKQSRLAVWPDLRWAGRAYALGSWEAVCWDHSAALALLGGLLLQRVADEDGRVSLYGQRHQVGRGYRGQTVEVSFSAASQQWVFSQRGQELARQQAWYLGAEQIRGLQVGRLAGARRRAAADQQRPDEAG